MGLHRQQGTMFDEPGDDAILFGGGNLDADAPKQLLFSQVMDPILLYAFAAAVVGGFTSLGGTFVGGIIIGVVVDLVSTYWGGDLTLASALGIMLLTLAVRPNGLFGAAEVARL